MTILGRVKKCFLKLSCQKSSEWKKQNHQFLILWSTKSEIRRENFNNKVNSRYKTYLQGLIHQSIPQVLSGKIEYHQAGCKKNEHTGKWYLLNVPLFISCDSSQKFFDLKRKTKSHRQALYSLGTLGKMHLNKEVANLYSSLRTACNKRIKQIFKAKLDLRYQYYLGICFILHSVIQLHIFPELIIGWLQSKNIYKWKIISRDLVLGDFFSYTHLWV